MSTSTALPIADSRTLRAYVRQVARTYARRVRESAIGSAVEVLMAGPPTAAPRG